MSDDDDDFERFLQEDDGDDDDVSVPSPPDARASRATAASSRSAAAVTSAAAALLASSKLLRSHQPKAKTTKPKKEATRRKKSAAEDDEEPPPSYAASRSDALDLDPYAFDLNASFHHHSESESSDTRDAKKKPKKKATKREQEKKTKATTKAEPPKREAISLEDRVAQILKRTGSSALQPSTPAAMATKSEDPSDDERSDEPPRTDGGDNLIKSAPLSKQAAPPTVAATGREQRKDESEDGSSDLDAKRLSLSDSLGMESADFEVGVHARRQLERSRLSMSSLNSEKFAVNVNALEESETDPRYPAQLDALDSKSHTDGEREDEEEEEELDPTDEYEDDGFELDQTTAGGFELASMASYSESYLEKDHGGFDTSKSDDEAPFVSQFERMKELFSVDSSFGAPSLGQDESHVVLSSAGGGGGADERALNTSSAQEAESDNFGYEDEDFESPPPPPPPDDDEHEHENDSDFHAFTLAQRRSTPTPAAGVTAEPFWSASPLVDLEAESQEIGAFLRQSRRAKLERQQLAVRSSAQKETELTLRLQHAQRQILQLKHHIRASDGGSDEADSIASEAGDNTGQDAATVSTTEYAALQKEMQTQETLIHAFQKENEQLMRQLKQLQRGAQYNLHVENEALRRQLKAARDDAERQPAADGTSMGQFHAAVEARLQAEAHALSLQDELDAVRARHQTRENELTVALDRVKKAKRELECRYEGVDLATIADETKRVRELQGELATTKAAAERARASLQKKLDWYVENQRLLDAQDDELQRLKTELKQLAAARPAAAARPQSAGTPSKSPARRSAADVRRISELELRLAATEDALRRRHPDSLVSLLVASRKAEEEATLAAMTADFQQQLQAKDAELEQLQAASETTLKSFRQQQEKLVLLFQRRIRELEKLLEQAHHTVPRARAGALKRGGPLGGAAPPRPTDDDEVARVRTFYTEKIKELEKKWDAKYRAIRKQQHVSGGGGGGASRELEGLSYADSTTIIMNLQRQLREREVAIKKLSAQVNAKHRELSVYVRHVEAQLKASEDARAHLVQTLSTLQTHSAAHEAQRHQDAVAFKTQESSSDSAQAQAALAARAEQEQAREQSDGREKALQVQANAHALEVERLQQRLHAAEQAARPLRELADRVPFLKHEVMQLREQLAVPRTPSMVQYRSLELKIETLMQKHLLREAELKVLLARAAQSSELEKLQLERVHQSALAAKNVEIRHFKKQLDVILVELELLKQPLPAAPPP
ncbi:hypothetical protein PybrP1_007115 [[Pythium] brassicae (nom. inval.)]|nr:hypothetical protein PybrP1_007115 [[Pythium] brassicae (nom. inval.)]